jgi:hypothetical protein
MTDAMREEIAQSFREKYKAEIAKKQAEYDEKLKAELAAIEQKQADERKALEQRLREKAAEDLAMEMRDLKDQLDDKAKKLAEAQTLELDLRKKQRELDERARTMELELTRKLAEERDAIAAAVRKQSDEEHDLKLKEKEKQLDDQRRQLDEMKRKLEQGSQQLQGEILELELEEKLRSTFPEDSIEPVAKGVRGGDVIQRISTSGDPCCILWETKRTKNWTEGWIPKLKADQRESKADMSVLVSSVLPKEISNFGLKDGVWISDYASAIGLAAVLRETLQRISMARVMGEGVNFKAEQVYKYVCGPEFRQRVEALVDAFKQMHDDLDAEKRAINRLWSKREAQIELMQLSTIAIHGKLHGIIGNALSEIPVLQLPPTESGDDLPL